MGFTAFVCLFILAFKIRNFEPCVPVYLSANPSVTYEGSTIVFKAESRGARKFEWDFGDGSQSGLNGANVTHNYARAGRYTVMVTVNGKCYKLTDVNVMKAPVIINNDQRPLFSGPVVTDIHKQVTFRDSTPDATSWEWNFGENDIGIVDASGRVAVYTYKKPGIKQIYLRINGSSNRIGTWEIAVNYPKKEEYIPPPSGGRPKDPGNTGPIKIRPTEPPIGPKDVPPPIILPNTDKPNELKVTDDIQPDGISEFLEEVVSGKKKAADFHKYFCGDKNITVEYNDQLMTFNQMCKELREIRKIKNIEKPVVKVAKTKETNCVVFMNVTVYKKGFFEKLLNKKK
jgi:hypothetical protein